MSGEQDVVDRLAESIADGKPIDWAEVDRLPVDDHLKRLLALLRVVDGVAEVHRSLGEAPADQPRADAHTTPATADFEEAAGPIGQWGKLQLVKKIGEGTFGEVFHAHDSWLDHPVALKLFKPSISGRNPATRILHEARKLARVRHPNVVVVHGADSHDGRVGFWMDLVEGTTLEVIVRQGRMSAGEAAYIGQEVCRALAAVHLAGIIHRDVKAQNVMRAADGGRIILMDFGAGEFIKEQAQGTSKQGTPLYLAPEIFENADASVRTDIYAVGVLLYYLVTGDFPVRGASVHALADAHRKGERRRLRDIRPDLPGPFVSVVERALDPDPARRFTSAGEMEAALGGDPIPIAKAGASWVQTLMRVSLVSATVVLTVLVLGLIACRTFDVALGVEPQFSAGIGEHFAVGVQALLPFAIAWLAGGVGLMAVAGLAPVFLGRPLAAFRERALAKIRSADGQPVATMIFLTGVIGWIAISWLCRDIFLALERLRVTQGAYPADVSALSLSARTLNGNQAVYSALLSFFLGLAAWRWFPVIERKASDPSRVRALRWATALLVFMIVATVTVPRRLVWERFEEVSFESERAFVIGSSGPDLLLYYPSRDGMRQRRVRADAPALQRTGARNFIFGGQ